MMLQQERENDQTVAEYVEAQSEMQMNSEILNAQTVGQEAVKKLQQDLEARVQKDLD